MELKYPDACFIIMGDFNQLPLKLNSYYQIVKKPTRNNKVLDKCFTKVKDGYEQCHQLAKLGKSDHYVMHLIPTYTPLSKKKTTTVTKRKYSEENIDNLRGCFETTIWDNLFHESDTLDQQTDIITDYIKFCTNLCIPEKTVKHQPNQKPWITKHIIEMIEAKQTAHQNGNRKLYHKLKNKITKEMKKSKMKYSNKIQQHLANDPAKAWTDIKKLSGLPATTTATDHDFKYTADELNTFFSRYEKTDINHAIPDETKVTAPNIEIDENTVLRQLKRLNTRKGAGPDGLIPKVIRLCSNQLAATITKLFQSSIEKHSTPTLWKSAIIKPLPKVNTPSQLKDYRPIALTSCLCKVMEKIIKNYIIQNTTIDQHQYAYRPGRSTQDAILCLLTTVTNFIDIKSSHYARCLFLDFSSAFNTIRVEYLIPQLQHLDTKVTGWITSFLSQRKQQTLVKDKLSKPITTNTGTPQGSVLSPLLFSIYTDKIRSSMSNVTILKYADDTCVIGCIGDNQDLCNYFSEINRIAQQCTDLDLLLNASKTKEMLFSTRRDKPASEPLILNGTEISFCSSVKYLGVEVDDRLRFEDHIENIVTKANQRMYIVRNFLYLSTKPLACMLFKSFVLSLLMYCLPILYTSLFSRSKKDIRDVVKRALRLGLEDIDSIDNIIQKRTKTLMLQMIHDSDHFINNFLEQCPSGRYRHTKYRSSWGRDCFLRSMSIKLNEFL